MDIFENLARSSISYIYICVRKTSQWTIIGGKFVTELDEDWRSVKH